LNNYLGSGILRLASTWGAWERGSQAPPRTTILRFCQANSLRISSTARRRTCCSFNSGWKICWQTQTVWQISWTATWIRCTTPRSIRCTI